MINNTYISSKDKRYIENYCKIQIENEDAIRVKAVAVMLSEQVALWEIMNYIKQDLGIAKDKIFHGEANYIVTMDRGHIQLVNDIFYSGCYLHQYVLHKQLNIEMEEVQQYVVHHIDLDKGNNNISNLHIFYDQAIHMAYHQLLKKGINIEIRQFTLNYMEGIIDKNNADAIRKYIKLLDKLQEKVGKVSIPKKGEKNILR